MTCESRFVPPLSTIALLELQVCVVPGISIRKVSGAPSVDCTLKPPVAWNPSARMVRSPDNLIVIDCRIMLLQLLVTFRASMTVLLPTVMLVPLMLSADELRVQPGEAPSP